MKQLSPSLIESSNNKYNISNKIFNDHNTSGHYRYHHTCFIRIVIKPHCMPNPKDQQQEERSSPQGGSHQHSQRMTNPTSSLSSDSSSSSPVEDVSTTSNPQSNHHVSTTCATTSISDQNSTGNTFTFVNETLIHSQQQLHSQQPPQHHDLASNNQRVSPTSSSATTSILGNPNTSQNTPPSNNTTSNTFIKFLQPTHALRIKKLVTDEQFASNYTELRLTKIPAIYGNQQNVMHSQPRGSKSRRKAQRSKSQPQQQQHQTLSNAQPQQQQQPLHDVHVDTRQSPPPHGKQVSPHTVMGMQPKPPQPRGSDNIAADTNMAESSSCNLPSPQIQQFPPFSIRQSQPPSELFHVSSLSDPCFTTTASTRDVNNQSSSTGGGLVPRGFPFANHNLLNSQAIHTPKQPATYSIGNNSTSFEWPQANNVTSSSILPPSFSQNIHDTSVHHRSPPFSHNVNTPPLLTSSLSSSLAQSSLNPQQVSYQSLDDSLPAASTTTTTTTGCYPHRTTPLQMHHPPAATTATWSCSSLSPPHACSSVFPLKLSIEDLLLELNLQQHQ